MCFCHIGGPVLTGTAQLEIYRDNCSSSASITPAIPTVSADTRLIYSDRQLQACQMVAGKAGRIGSFQAVSRPTLDARSNVDFSLKQLHKYRQVLLHLEIRLQTEVHRTRVSGKALLGNY